MLTWIFKSGQMRGNNNERKLKMDTRFKDTAAIRTFISDTLQLMKSGAISNSVARTRLQAGKLYVDTVKLDIMAMNAGRPLSTAVIDNGKLIEHEKQEV